MIGVCFLTAAVLAVWFGFGFGKGGERTLRISWDGAEMERLALPLERKGRMNTASGQEETLYCLMRYTEGGIFFAWYEERPDRIINSWEQGYNLLVISGDRVWMEAADCRDQICVHHIPISAGGENIICLPNRLVVEIVDDAEGEKFDKLVQ